MAPPLEPEKGQLLLNHKDRQRGRRDTPKENRDTKKQKREMDAKREKKYSPHVL